MNSRNLRFTNFDEVEAELSKLEDVRVRTTGVWSYFQILDYCASQVEGSLKGFPATGVFKKMIRKLFGTWRLNAILKRGYIQNTESDKLFNSKKREEGDEKKALDKLKSSITAFKEHKGKMAIHPVYDSMDKQTWEKYLSMLTANCLNFVFIVEGYDKDERSEKVDKIKEELLRNLNAKIENKEVPKPEVKVEAEEKPTGAADEPAVLPEIKVSETVTVPEIEEIKQEEVSEDVPIIAPEPEAVVLPISEETIEEPDVVPTVVLKKKAAAKKKVAKKKTVAVQKKKAIVAKKKVVTKKKVAKKKVTTKK
jgi:hypothetical protein